MIDKKILEEMQEYIHLHLNQLELYTLKSSELIEDSLFNNVPDIVEQMQNIELENFIKTKRKPTLKEVLFAFIDKRELTDPEVYKKAGIDRKHFNKIRSIPNYQPKKNTILSLALALKLNKKETDKLLSSAGYSLSDSDTSDLVIQFCLEKNIYDIQDVNEALDYFSLKPLGGVL